MFVNGFYDFFDCLGVVYLFFIRHRTSKLFFWKSIRKLPTYDGLKRYLVG